MDAIRDWWTHFFEHGGFWNAFWPAIWGALAGAITITLIDHYREKRRRIRREVGECNKLIFILGQMVSFLEDVNDYLFENPRKKYGRPAQWHEVGALEGAPDRGPDFILGEYTFLLEDEDADNRAPDVLGDIYRAEGNFKAVLNRINVRSRLWHEYSDQQANSQFERGQEAMPHRALAGATPARIRELTAWLAEDIPETIAALRKIMPDLRQVLDARYPGRKFIDFWPANDPHAAPLSATNRSR
jgi:hypothetical protein